MGVECSCQRDQYEKARDIAKEKYAVYSVVA